ncbi:galactose-1-phosphate uridylyltransferase [Pendulispora albinea]|uniref:Galactose-1-phosphate uridylyltransferase n=1 Tax=Pendulispora albinea TaxID=2741071 RepID=A0ABZ2M8Y7_9BACT
MTIPTNKTRTVLSDGRELIYFDDRPGIPRTAPDLRNLAPHRPQSEIRYDPVLDDWVIVAAHRQTRTNLPAASECPLCPTRGASLSEIPADDYHVVTFENRFPSLGGAYEGRGDIAGGGVRGAPGGLADDGAPSAAFQPIEPGVGRCEVVCFTSDHTSSFVRLSPERLHTVAAAWVDRTLHLSQVPGVEQVFIFENRGAEIGATLDHPHGQIYGYPFVTSRTSRALASAARWRDGHGSTSCLFCAIIADEREKRLRIVEETPSFIAFVPAAPRFPYELHVYPRRHVPDLPSLTAPELTELMSLQVDLLRRYERLFDKPIPYMACWHQAPVRVGRDLSHLSLQLMSPQRAPNVLKFFASSESGMHAYTMDVLPETIAARFRDVK